MRLSICLPKKKNSRKSRKLSALNLHFPPTNSQQLRNFIYLFPFAIFYSHKPIEAPIYFGIFIVNYLSFVKLTFPSADRKTFLKLKFYANYLTLIMTSRGILSIYYGVWSKGHTEYYYLNNISSEKTNYVNL